MEDELFSKDHRIRNKDRKMEDGSNENILKSNKRLNNGNKNK